MSLVVMPNINLKIGISQRPAALMTGKNSSPQPTTNYSDNTITPGAARYPGNPEIDDLLNPCAGGARRIAGVSAEVAGGPSPRMNLFAP